MNSQNIVIYFMSKSETYTIIPHELQEDIPVIGLEAFCIACDFLRFSNSKTHTANIHILSKKLGISKGRIAKGLNSLIEHGYLKRIRKRDDKGNYAGFIYQFFSPKQIAEIPKINDEEEYKNNNLEKEKNINNVTSKKITPKNTLLELFKSYKLEKRVMPQTVRLLKEYEDKFDLEVFNEVFQSAGNTSITHKFTYIKTVFKNLVEKNIKTIEEYQKDYEEFKNMKNKRQKKKKNDNDKNNRGNGGNYSDKENYKNEDKKNKGISKIHTRHHDIEQTWSKYEEKELEDMLLRNQRKKFGENTLDIKDFDYESMNFSILYHSARKKEVWDYLSKELKEKLLRLCKEKGKEILSHWVLV